MSANWKYSIKTKAWDFFPECYFATPTTRRKSIFAYFSFHLLLLRSTPEGEHITMYGNTRWSCGWVPCTILERNFNYGCSRKDRGQSPILHSFFIGLKLKKLKKCNNYTKRDQNLMFFEHFSYNGSPFRNITSPYWRNVSCACLESRWAGLNFFDF